MEITTFIIALIGALAAGYSTVVTARVKSKQSVNEVRINSLESALIVERETVSQLRIRQAELTKDIHLLEKKIDDYEAEIARKESIIIELQQKLQA